MANMAMLHSRRNASLTPMLGHTMSIFSFTGHVVLFVLVEIFSMGASQLRARSNLSIGSGGQGTTVPDAPNQGCCT